MVSEDKLSEDEYLKNWVAAIKSLDFAKMYGVEILYYLRSIKPNESAVRWESWQQKTFNYRQWLTEQLTKAKPTRELECSSTTCLFVYEHNSGLAHETTVADTLKALRDEYPDITPYVCFLTDAQVERSASRIFDLPKEQLIYLSGGSFHEAYRKLETLIDQIRPKSITYVANFFLAFYLSLLITHSNQKFLVTKYIPWQAGRLREFAVGPRTKSLQYTKGDFTYTCLPWLGIRKPTSVVKRKFDDGQLYFGSISRVEKIKNPTYQQFVIEMLSKYPRLTYLYTVSKKQETEIPSQFASHSRCINIGYIEPLDWINSFDLYVEPFPFGGGEMSFLALSNGRPYLSFSHEETGVQINLHNTFHDEGDFVSFSLCSSLEILKRRFDEFITDPHLRLENGQNWKNLFNVYRGNSYLWREFLLK